MSQNTKAPIDSDHACRQITTRPHGINTHTHHNMSNMSKHMFTNYNMFKNTT